MLIVDQLKRNDPPLRALALVVLGGLGVLLIGVWWVQVVSAKRYQSRLETQSFRTVRVPAVRGKILDRNGVALAENRPSFNIGLYLEELRRPFDTAYAEEAGRERTNRALQRERLQQQLQRKLTTAERRRFVLTTEQRAQLRRKARHAVASNVVAQISERLQQPLTFTETIFQRHYDTRLALPFPLLVNLDAAQVARFAEQSPNTLGADLEVQSLRIYPLQTTAAHLLGYLTRDDSSLEGEAAFFSYRLADYRGVVGVEAGFDAVLRGRAGAKSVLVNSLGYRQTENVWAEAEPGRNVVLTIDLRLQQAAEHALLRAGANPRGAVVIMDVRNGDVLALASAPAPNPNHFVHGFPPGELERLNDETLRPQINRAMQENYAPGSIFKTVVALAALEAGLNPNQTFHVEADPRRPGKGCIYIGRRKIDDTVTPGPYNFRRALLKSSNAYFITNGLRAGIHNIVKLSQRFHLGERTGLPTRQETAGALPSLREVSGANWFNGDTANICIGQGKIDVTPLQMAVVTSAIANGGKVFWPRLVDRLEPQETVASDEIERFEAGRVRDELRVSARSLRILHDAMLADVEDSEGTGRDAAVPGLRLCGKTGTAQITDTDNRVVGHTTWFISFAPYERPRYALVVMIEGGGSGGGTCAPVAHEIYSAIKQLETRGAGALARAE